jgi:hypothetical protein
MMKCFIQRKNEDGTYEERNFIHEYPTLKAAKQFAKEGDLIHTFDKYRDRFTGQYKFAHYATRQYHENGKTEDLA